VSEQIELKQVLEEAGGYSVEAYRFLSDGLAHTVTAIHGEDVVAAASTDDPEDESLHVSGQELCLGLRDYAIRRYGLLARTVLGRWNIRTTDDFGRIVFALVDAGLMRKTDRDHFEDFQGVYDFEEEFIEPDHTSVEPSAPADSPNAN
jgi:uncharacterized repeat protein (TIGR04138 family)